MASGRPPGGGSVSRATGAIQASRAERLGGCPPVGLAARRKVPRDDRLWGAPVAVPTVEARAPIVFTTPASPI
eukprot:12454392-Alexandrium_andersonii.AAC.1